MSFSVEWLDNPPERARFELSVKIFEKAAGPGYPVVEHVFRGKTREEAEGYYRAHLKSDTFFKDCIEKERFNGVECWSTSEWRQV